MKNKEYTCTVHNSITEEQKKEWQELWSRSGMRHFFNSPDFFDAYREVFGIERYKVFFCYREGRLCGVLPLISGRVFGIKAFFDLGRKGNYADKSALLLDEYDKQAFEALVDKIIGLGNFYIGEADEKIRSILAARKVTFILEHSSESYWAMFSENTGILDLMPIKQRKNLLRRIQMREKDLEFKFFETGSKEALDTVIDIEKHSYKPHLHMAFFTRRSAKKLMEYFIKHNPQNIRIGILYYQNTPVAAVLGFVCDKIFFCYYIAFREEHRSWGAGKAAIYFILERLRKEGFVKIDFLRGNAEFKKQFVENTDCQYNFYFSKDSAVMLWWSFCVPLWNILKKTKQFVENFPEWLISRSKKCSRILLRIGKEQFISFSRFIIMRFNIFFSMLRGGDNRKNKKTGKPIIIFSSYDDRDNPAYGGGGAFAVHQAAKRLAKKYAVFVLTGKFPGCLHRESSDSVHYERIGSAFFGPKLGHLIFHFALPFYVISKKFDIWIESFTPPFSASFLPLFTKKPVIGLAHMLSAEDMQRKYYFPFVLIENLGLKYYRHIIATSKHFQDRIAAQNPSAQIALISNGVCLNKFLLKKKYDAEYISFLGRIEIDQKGLDLLLEAYKKIADKIKIPLVIAGSGTYKNINDLRRLIKKLDLEGRVLLVGRISEKEREVFFRRSFLNIVSSRFETFSMVALETIASGTPLVAFNINGLQWIPEQCCIKAPEINSDSLARAILRGLEDKDLREDIIRNGEVFAENFDWGLIGRQYDNLICKILKVYGSGFNKKNN